MYKIVSRCESFELPQDVPLVSQLQREIDDTIKSLDEKRADCEENYGDIEVKNAILDKADFFNRIGEKEKAIEAYEEAYCVALFFSWMLEWCRDFLKTQFAEICDAVGT